MFCNKTKQLKASVCALLKYILLAYHRTYECKYCIAKLEDVQSGFQSTVACNLHREFS